MKLFRLHLCTTSLVCLLSLGLLPLPATAQWLAPAKKAETCHCMGYQDCKCHPDACDCDRCSGPVSTGWLCPTCAPKSKSPAYCTCIYPCNCGCGDSGVCKCAKVVTVPAEPHILPVVNPLPFTSGMACRS